VRFVTNDLRGGTYQDRHGRKIGEKLAERSDDTQELS
jgi:hypothetical protein